MSHFRTSFLPLLVLLYFLCTSIVPNLFGSSGIFADQSTAQETEIGATQDAKL